MSYFALLWVIVVIVILINQIHIVPQGYEWTVERFGKYTRTLKPGVAMLFPLIDAVGRKVGMREQVVPITNHEIMPENKKILVNGSVSFRIFDAAKATYEVANIQEAVVNLIMTRFSQLVNLRKLDISSRRPHQW